MTHLIPMHKINKKNKLQKNVAQEKNMWFFAWLMLHVPIYYLVSTHTMQAIIFYQAMKMETFVRPAVKQILEIKITLRSEQSCRTCIYCKNACMMHIMHACIKQCYRLLQVVMQNSFAKEVPQLTNINLSHPSGLR